MTTSWKDLRERREHFDFMRACVNIVPALPYVGMPGCQQVGSDRYPVIVTEIRWNRAQTKIVSIRLSSIPYKRVDKNGLSESQDYEFFPEMVDLLHGEWYTLRSNGRFVLKGQGPRSCPVYLGRFAAYQDPSF